MGRGGDVPFAGTRGSISPELVAYHRSVTEALKSRLRRPQLEITKLHDNGNALIIAESQQDVTGSYHNQSPFLILTGCTACRLDLKFSRLGSKSTISMSTM